MRKFLLCWIVTILLVSTHVGAQDGYTERAKKYVDQYATLAICEQRKNGIPAAITLGQGILETEAGTSELMTEANNHFGIKCKNGWTGETFTHTDDAPDECFKKYRCAEESYKDHSEHLKRNPRYSPLFKLKEEDYKSWAVCLKKCGYATNPQYAQKLIKIIEDFGLQQYTYSAFDSTLLNNYSENPVADAGSLLKPAPILAVKNDSAPATQPQAKVIYASYKEPAQATGKQHIVAAGETLNTTAQDEGIDLKKLMSLNLLNPNEEPVVGAVLELQTQARQKPAVKVNPLKAHSENAIISGDDKTHAQNGDYIAINRSRPKATADTTRAKPVKPAQVATATKNPVPEKPKPIIIITEPDRRPVRPAERPDPDDPEVKKEGEFTALKAELDKVVYADDSKLIADNPPTPAPEKKQTVAPEKKPVVVNVAAKAGKFYTVKKGDTAFSIAKKNNITVDQLMKWNNMDAGTVKVGQSLQVKE